MRIIGAVSHLSPIGCCVVPPIECSAFVMSRFRHFHLTGPSRGLPRFFLLKGADHPVSRRVNLQLRVASIFDDGAHYRVLKFSYEMIWLRRSTIIAVHSGFGFPATRLRHTTRG